MSITSYFIKDNGVDIHIGDVNDGERIRWNHNNWERFQNATGMRDYIMKCEYVFDSFGNKMTSKMFLELPSIMKGKMSGHCIIRQGRVFDN